MRVPSTVLQILLSIPAIYVSNSVDANSSTLSLSQLTFGRSADKILLLHIYYVTRPCRVVSASWTGPSLVLYAVQSMVCPVERGHWSVACIYDLEAVSMQLSLIVQCAMRYVTFHFTQSTPTCDVQCHVIEQWRPCIRRQYEFYEQENRAEWLNVYFPFVEKSIHIHWIRHTSIISHAITRVDCMANYR